MFCILIADDDPDIRELLTITFARADFAVVTAADGLAALRAAEQWLPDAVLTDMDMPGLTGEQLCRAIRGHPRLRTIPMALLSGTLYPYDDRCRRAGSCAVMLEPMSNQSLVATMRDLIARGPHHHRPSDACCAAPARPSSPDRLLAATSTP